MTDQSGATLVELVVSIAVVSVAVTGLLMAIHTGVRQSADPMIEHQSVAVAEAYLEEILLRDYYDPDLGPPGGVCPGPEPTRDLYDNVCDYDGTDDTGPLDQYGNALAGLSAFRVRVSVDQTATLFDLVGSADVLRVDVRVTHPAFADLTLSGYRARY